MRTNIETDRSAFATIKWNSVCLAIFKASLLTLVISQAPALAVVKPSIGM